MSALSCIISKTRFLSGNEVVDVDVDAVDDCDDSNACGNDDDDINGSLLSSSWRAWLLPQWIHDID
eukprot:CAMPEP_0203645898 /NCGR_PEP_ID=MMETSP0088-20131115/11924_1 /ASSEMBLY_ACC=CAM_ASM_001087 /TAXON_ID=426623 /ORGANISM="Chaetoceros affinis, Strain CCMP159" /LENGTH=65 /DNA_ID=CAMNT_0050502929 /DNA_START=90 /DNA_END=284 /DNA_ORIENTATION=-